MPAQVACAECAEDRVGERVCGDVGVGMAAESLVVLDLDAAGHEAAPRFERMKIESVAYAKTRRHCCIPRAAGALFALRRTALTSAISAAKLLLIAPSGGSLAMPAFAKNPKFIIGTLVVLWVAYVIYANFQIEMVTFYLLPFNILKLQLRLWAVIIGSAIFGSVATLVIHWLWVRPSNSSSSTVAAPIPPSSPPRSSTVA